MRVYIAGPIAGHADQNLPAFRAAADLLAARGHEPVIPHSIPPWSHEGQCPITYQAGQAGHDSACYLRGDLIWLLYFADAVAFLPSWETSRGARVERVVSEAIGLPIITLEDA